MAETDVWEAIAAAKSLVRVDANRQYISGHSMGGYGAWHIARTSPPGTWAALGVHAGAMNHDRSDLSPAAIQALRDIPTYFVVGATDGLLSSNEVAHGLLQGAGNPNLVFLTFPGGHDYRHGDAEQMYLWMRQFDVHGRRTAVDTVSHTN
jgi:S-formylglutathione hydrolase FrmB